MLQRKFKIILVYEVIAETEMDAVTKLAKFHSDVVYNQVQKWYKERRDKGMDTVIIEVDEIDAEIFLIGEE